jgi:hypothetical protein
MTLSPRFQVETWFFSSSSKSCTASCDPNAVTKGNSITKDMVISTFIFIAQQFYYPGVPVFTLLLGGSG